MAVALFQYYTQSPITASLKRKGIYLPEVAKQIPSNLKNLSMVVKTNTVRSQHLFLSVDSRFI